MMQDNQKRLRILRELREAGFLVEIDDFGSGYSSLNLLKDMPIDLVKVDMLFLKEAECNKKAQTILRNIMHMTGDLGIPALTEGVETEEQFRMLLEMGCSLFQGYYFAKPMPQDQFEAFCFSDRGYSLKPQPE
jgi:EAL domain-containing protein (putative c-di-GMP-specific phosphodiesterase class I)